MNDRSQSNEFRDKRLSTIRLTLRISQHDFWSLRERPKPSVMIDVSLKQAIWTWSKMVAHQNEFKHVKRAGDIKNGDWRAMNSFCPRCQWCDSVDDERAQTWNQLRPQFIKPRCAMMFYEAIVRQVGFTWMAAPWLSPWIVTIRVLRSFFLFFFALWCFVIRPQLEEIFHVDEHFRVFCESDTSGLCGSAMSCNWAKRWGILYTLSLI